MLEVWTWPTRNGHKVHIALEELGLEYKVIPVNIGAGRSTSAPTSRRLSFANSARPHSPPSTRTGSPTSWR